MACQKGGHLGGQLAVGAPLLLLLLLATVAFPTGGQAGITDLFKSGNKSEKLAAPICGNEVFSSNDRDGSLSPEIILITNQQSRSYYARRLGGSSSSESSRITPVAREFRFNAENVTLDELERHGFDRHAPVTFVIHGFTSGYPKQPWISAFVESYTLDRDQGRASGRQHYGPGEYSSSSSSWSSSSSSSSSGGRERDSMYGNSPPPSRSQSLEDKVKALRDRVRHIVRENAASGHNLFIVNWNHAARGNLYPRAVANIPIVAGYVTQFINEKLLDEARVEPQRIQLVGHSLGAHLAGFVGKSTKAKLGRIYGLDPAGPCFGSLSGSLYPPNKRLAPSDADEVITIHTNSALLGIDEPLGKWSVFVEGGQVQPGCKGNGGLIKSLASMSADHDDFKSISCSHSRGPNLLIYRHGLENDPSADTCQLVAYECKDWETFLKGQCGICGRSRDVSSSSSSSSSLYSSTSSLSSSSSSSSSSRSSSSRSSFSSSSADEPFKPSECIRIGLDWQYPSASHRDNAPSSDYNEQPTRNSQPERESYNGAGGAGGNFGDSQSAHRRPDWESKNSTSESGVWRKVSDWITDPGKLHSQKLNSTHSRDNKNQTNISVMLQARRDPDPDVKPKSLFIRTGDTQPYCVYHYQIVLELKEPFPGRERPDMALVLQESESPSSVGRNKRQVAQQSLTEDKFGHRLSDTIYTHLSISAKSLGKVEHATMLFADGLPDGYKYLRMLHVNYMSHLDPYIRQRLSSRLCPVRSNVDGPRDSALLHNRYYFEPCDE